MKFLNRSEVLNVLQVSQVTLWRMIRDGQFPRPIQISTRRIAWLDSDIEAWLKARISERDRGESTGSTALRRSTLDKVEA